MKKWIWINLGVMLIMSLTACESKQSAMDDRTSVLSFSAETLKVPDGGVRKIRGQVLYMPIYSNIPYMENRNYDLSAFLAVHNTDLQYRIKITKVDFFNTQGRLVKSFVFSDQPLDPLATVIFVIPQQDQSGTGANFLVEWVADQPVTEPLIESIMKDLSGNKGLSFLSQGKVIREME